MNWRKVGKWTLRALLGFIVLAVVLLFIVDRRLNPPVDAPDLLAITLPAGAPFSDDWYVFDSDETGTFEVFATNRETGEVVQLTDDETFDSWWARISPDRRTVLFYRTPAGTHDRDFTKTSLWMMTADGDDLTEVLPIGSHGWNQHGHAEWSPDGTELVMFGGKRTNPHIFVTSADGRSIRDIAGDSGSNLDPSWSPDGEQIVYVGCPARICFGDDQEIYTVAATGGERQRLTDDGLRDHDPYYSPDGSRIAFLTETEGRSESAIVGVWDIRLIDADVSADDGVEPRRLIDDRNINSMPKWVDDNTIIFHRLVYGELQGFDIYAVEVDSGELTALIATGASEEYPDPGG